MVQGKRTLCWIVLFNFTNESSPLFDSNEQQSTRTQWFAPLAIVIPVVSSIVSSFFSPRTRTNKLQLFELHLQVRVTPDSGAFPYILFQFMQVRSRLCTLCILKFAICALLYQYLRILDIENGIRMRENVKFVYKMLMKVASCYWMNYYYKIYKFDIFITCWLFITCLIMD